MASAAPTADIRRDLFLTGLRNAHAMEKQALSIASPQVARLEHYPELAERIRLHIDETERQIARLDDILADFDTSGSALKDMALSLSGGMASAMHTLAGDEVVKNSFANYAFEHFEIAAYTSLLTLADDGGLLGAAALRESLAEEQAMAAWIGDALPDITRRYAALYAAEGAGVAKS